MDTDVFSFFFKKDTRAEAYHPYTIGRSLFVSFMTVAELDKWALQNNWGDAQKARLAAQLSKFAIHPVDRNLCLKWAEVTDSTRRSGRIIQTADAWIAATALILDVPLLTHNVSDFVGVEGLTILSQQIG